MGALNESRARQFRQRYRDSESASLADGEKEIPKYHYGSHYSNAAAVLYYLIRLQPFTETLIKFQSGRFDRPDRLFHSVKATWLSASRLSTSDVKEAIPELFYSAEMFRNGNRLQLGSRQSRSAAPVSDVVLPRWAHGSSREFVRVHRQALESEFVSAHLHHWIDLIFGVKQQGEAAERALNVFYYLVHTHTHTVCSSHGARAAVQSTAPVDSLHSRLPSLCFALFVPFFFLLFRPTPARSTSIASLTP